MDWMYKGVSGLVDKEEYLTGRRIDKTFEVIHSEETQTKGDLDAFEPSIPGSVLDNNPSAKSLVTIDLAAKLREDPLYEIRVKQREQRKKLLDNPLKLKKLKTILESTLTEDKHKKHKKKKKRRTSSSSSDSSDDSDHQRRHKTLHKSHSREKSNDRRHSEDRRHSDNRRDSSDRRHKRDKYESNRDKERERETKGSERRVDYKLKDLKSERRIEKRFNTKQNNDLKPKRLSAEELERKRKEMIENAVWRECQRKSNVKSYEEEEKVENEINSSVKSPQFIKPLLKSATESKSLEERIKQKRFRSQRGYDSMDKNFAKK